MKGKILKFLSTRPDCATSRIRRATSNHALAYLKQLEEDGYVTSRLQKSHIEYGQAHTQFYWTLTEEGAEQIREFLPRGPAMEVFLSPDTSWLASNTNSMNIRWFDFAEFLSLCSKSPILPNVHPDLIELIKTPFPWGADLKPGKLFFRQVAAWHAWHYANEIRPDAREGAQCITSHVIDAAIRWLHCIVNEEGVLKQGENWLEHRQRVFSKMETDKEHRTNHLSLFMYKSVSAVGLHDIEPFVSKNKGRVVFVFNPVRHFLTIKSNDIDVIRHINEVSFLNQGLIKGEILYPPSKMTKGEVDDVWNKTIEEET